LDDFWMILNDFVFFGWFGIFLDDFTRKVEQTPWKSSKNHQKIIQKSSKNHPNPENDQNFGHLQTFSDWTQETARISDCGKMDAQKACCSSKMPTWKRPQKIARFLLELHKETPSCLLREIPSVWQLRPNVWDLKHHVSWLNTHLWWSNRPSRKSC
jgi:hypothetical protein